MSYDTVLTDPMFSVVFKVFSCAIRVSFPSILAGSIHPPSTYSTHPLVLEPCRGFWPISTLTGGTLFPGRHRSTDRPRLLSFHPVVPAPPSNQRSASCELDRVLKTQAI